VLDIVLQVDLSPNKKKQIEELPYDIRVKCLKKLKGCEYGAEYVVSMRISLNGLVEFYQLMADLNINQESMLIRKCIADKQDEIKGKS
jgi:hypothetical protein